ncbi:AAA family ATPase [Coxiella endosymbiont of Ornithodoros maritimus]
MVAILGPRQCGKTTLAWHYFKSHGSRSENYFVWNTPLTFCA